MAYLPCCILNIYQRILLNENVRMQIKCTAPQGSVLGPNFSQCTLNQSLKYTRNKAYKTEVVIFTSQRNEKRVESVSVKVGEAHINLNSKCVRNLAAFLYSEMSMEKHIYSVF